MTQGKRSPNPFVRHEQLTNRHVIHSLTRIYLVNGLVMSQDLGWELDKGRCVRLSPSFKRHKQKTVTT